MSPRLLESISKQISFHFRSHQRVHHGVLRLNCHVFSCLSWVCDYVMYCDTFMQCTYSVASLQLPIWDFFSVSIARLFTKYLTLGLCYNQANWLQESGSLLIVCLLCWRLVRPVCVTFFENWLLCLKICNLSIPNPPSNKI